MKLINTNNGKVVLDTEEREPAKEIKYPRLYEGVDLKKKYFGQPGTTYEEVDYSTLLRFGFFIVERSTSKARRKKRRGDLKDHTLHKNSEKNVGGIECKNKPEKVMIVYDNIKERVCLRGPTCGVYGYSRWRYLDE